MEGAAAEKNLLSIHQETLCSAFLIIILHVSHLAELFIVTKNTFFRGMACGR